MKQLLREPGSEGLTALGTADWGERKSLDLARGRANTSSSEWFAIETVLERAVNSGAKGVALTGSAARGRQTAISDVDLHVVGPRPRFADLDLALDLYAVDPETHWRRLRAGDDFAQWTLRFGCILEDQGVFRESAEFLVRTRLWPDSARKAEQARRVLAMAERVLATGDEDAAQEHVRGALTAVARVVLLEAEAFPLSRGELAEQVETFDFDLADALRRSIHGELGLDELAAGCAIADRLLRTF